MKFLFLFLGFEKEYKMQERLYIPPTIETPEIAYEPSKKTLSVTGQSYPSDSIEFYRPVFEWLQWFLLRDELLHEQIVIFKLKYYNTATSKQFANIFRILEESLISSSLKILWYYHEDDVEMYEAGIRFSMFSNLKFEIRTY